jgi:ATP-dependent DNA ligase
MYTGEGTYISPFLTEALDDLGKLSNREVTGNAAREMVAKVLNGLVSEDAWVVEHILKRDLRCGVSVSSINKIWPGLIPTYPVMLCETYSEKTKKHITLPARVQTKMDGMRVNVHVTPDGVEVFSRNGKPLTTHGVFDALHEKVLLLGGEVVIDGELVYVDDNGFADRKTGNGIGNKAIRGTISKEEAQQLSVYAWDIIPMHAFKAGSYDMPYGERWNILNSITTKINEHRLLNVVNNLVAETEEEIFEIYEMMLSEGEEGVIVKSDDAPWEDRRSRSMLKLKEEKECELRVIGFNEGEGKFAGNLGSVVFESGCKKLLVNVSGFIDEMRSEIWENRDKYLDSIATIRYNAIIDAKDRDVKSLFLPRFVTWRLDKDTANTMLEIK